jgi:hypothetical protein
MVCLSLGVHPAENDSTCNSYGHEWIDE